jgi:hypothetical protein
VPLPLMVPLLEPVPPLSWLPVMLPLPVLPVPLVVPLPEPVLPLPVLPVPLMVPLLEPVPLLPMSPVVPVLPVLPVVPLPLVEPAPPVEPILLPEPELLPPPDPLPCAKTNVAVMQSTARVRMSIFFVDVRFFMVSFEPFWLWKWCPGALHSWHSRCPTQRLGYRLIQQFTCHRGEAKPWSVEGTPESRLMGRRDAG